MVVAILFLAPVDVQTLTYVFDFSSDPAGRMQRRDYPRLEIENGLTERNVDPGCVAGAPNLLLGVDHHVLPWSLLFTLFCKSGYDPAPHRSRSFGPADATADLEAAALLPGRVLSGLAVCQLCAVQMSPGPPPPHPHPLPLLTPPPPTARRHQIVMFLKINTGRDGTATTRPPSQTGTSDLGSGSGSSRSLARSRCRPFLRLARSPREDCAATGA